MERETAIKDRTIALCMKVSGKAGENTQEEVFLEFDAALRQSDIFQAAGYQDVVIQPTHVAYDADDGKWYFAKIEGPATINASAVSAQYSRASINPCISVYEYDRERERGQRVTGWQLIAAVLAIMTICAGPGLYFGISVAIISKGVIVGKMIFVGICTMTSLATMVGIPYLRNKALSMGVQLAGIYWVED